MTQNDKFGFGFAGLDDFKPRAKKPQGEDKSGEAIDSEVDKTAAQLGFTSREKPVTRKKRSGVSKPTDQFNLRAHIEDINRFVDYAEKTNKSYREVFSDLVKKLT